MEFDNNNTNIIGLDLPQKDNRGLAGLFLRYFSTLGALVCDTQSSTDFRIEMFVNLMIASIPEDETRDTVKQFKKQLIDEHLGVLDSQADVDEKNQARITACMEVVGEISGYVDQYLGTSKKISVSIEAVYPDGDVYVEK